MAVDKKFIGASIKEFTFKLTDFGISRIKESSISDTKVVGCGNLNYMSPEIGS